MTKQEVLSHSIPYLIAIASEIKKQILDESFLGMMSQDGKENKKVLDKGNIQSVKDFYL